MKKHTKNVALMAIGFAAIIIPTVTQILEQYPKTKVFVQMIGGLSNLLAFTKSQVEAAATTDEAKQ